MYLLPIYMLLYLKLQERERECERDKSYFKFNDLFMRASVIEYKISKQLSRCYLHHKLDIPRQLMIKD